MMSDLQTPPDLRLQAPRATVTGAEDSLQSINTNELPDGALCFVISNTQLYRLARSSVTPPSGDDVVAPAAGPGRWLKYSAATADPLAALSNVLYLDGGTAAAVADRNGSIATPYKTMAEARAGAIALGGATILITPGDYTVGGTVDVTVPMSLVAIRPGMGTFPGGVQATSLDIDPVVVADSVTCMLTGLGSTSCTIANGSTLLMIDCNIIGDVLGGATGSLVGSVILTGSNVAGAVTANSFTGETARLGFTIEATQLVLTDTHCAGSPGNPFMISVNTIQLRRVEFATNAGTITGTVQVDEFTHQWMQSSGITATNINSIAPRAFLDLGNSGAALAVNFDRSPAISVTLTNSTPALTVQGGTGFIGPVALRLVQGAGGNHVPTFSANVLFDAGAPPTLSVAAAAVDLIMLYSDGAGNFLFSSFAQALAP